MGDDKAGPELLPITTLNDPDVLEINRRYRQEIEDIEKHRTSLLEEAEEKFVRELFEGVQRYYLPSVQMLLDHKAAFDNVIGDLPPFAGKPTVVQSWLVLRYGGEFSPAVIIHTDAGKRFYCENITAKRAPHWRQMLNVEDTPGTYVQYEWRHGSEHGSVENTFAEAFSMLTVDTDEAYPSRITLKVGDAEYVVADYEAEQGPFYGREFIRDMEALKESDPNPAAYYARCYEIENEWVERMNAEGDPS